MDGMKPTDADFVSLVPESCIGDRDAKGEFNVPTMCLAQDSKFIDAGEILAGYDDYKGSKPDLGWKEYDGEISSEIINIDADNKSVQGMRRLNIYTINGKMVGMAADGNISNLGLKSGVYIVQDFDTNKSVKVYIK